MNLRRVVATALLLVAGLALAQVVDPARPGTAELGTNDGGATLVTPDRQAGAVAALLPERTAPDEARTTTSTTSRVAATVDRRARVDLPAPLLDDGVSATPAPPPPPRPTGGEAPPASTAPDPAEDVRAPTDEESPVTVVAPPAAPDPDELELDEPAQEQPAQPQPEPPPDGQHLPVDPGGPVLAEDPDTDGSMAGTSTAPRTDSSTPDVPVGAAWWQDDASSPTRLDGAPTPAEER